MSVIDALSAGFGALGRSPGWALIPVAVDILLWLGPRLSPRPLVVRAFEDLSRLSTRLAAEGAADALEAWRQAAEQAGSVNLLGLITWWQVPTVIGPRPVPSPWPVPTIAVESWPLGLGLTVGVALAGLLLAAVYLGGLASALRGGAPGSFVAFALRGWGRLTVLVLLGLAALAVTAVPVLILVAVLNLISPALAEAVTLLWAIGLVWVNIYLFFVHPAMFVSDIGPVEAVKASVGLVRRNFWPAMGLILLFYLISFGMSIIWNALMAGWAGVLLAVAGNAVVASGLILGTMVFYKDRSGRQREVSLG